MKRARYWLAASLAAASLPAHAQIAASMPAPSAEPDRALTAAGEDAQRRLALTFTNLKFENFEASPIKGQIYQAMAGGRLLYFAPKAST